MNYRRLFIENGLVFLTIVTNNRIPILITNIELLSQSYRNVVQYYKFDLKFLVMVVVESFTARFTLYDVPLTSFNLLYSFE